MAELPNGPQIAVKYTLTGPDGTKAVFNDTTDPDYVGALSEVTGLDSPEVRENAENITGLDGGIHGEFFYGRRPITLSGVIYNVVSNEDRNKKITKLLQASNAMRSDALLEWTAEGGEATFVSVRRQGPVRITGGWVKDFQLALVSADPRIYASAISTGEVEAKDTTGFTTEAEPADEIIVENFLYVLNKGVNKISIYSIGKLGKLTLIETKATGTGPSGLAISSDLKSVYVTNQTANTISKFTRDTTTGKLTTLGIAIAAGEEPVDILSTTNTVIAVNKKSNTASVYNRNTSTGELTLKESKAVGTGPSAISKELGTTVIILAQTAEKVESYFIEEGGKLNKLSFAAIVGSPTNMYARYFGSTIYIFVSAKGFGSGIIYTYKLANGANPTLSSSLGTEYRPKEIFATERNLYAIDEANNKIYQYAINSLGQEGPVLETMSPAFTKTQIGATGIALRAITKSQPFSLLISKEPENTLLYVTNKTSGTITEYVVTAAGALSRQSQAATPSVTAINKGSMETYPVIYLTFSGEAELLEPVITNKTTGESLSFVGLIGGAPMVIDMLNRTVTQGGSNKYALLNASSSSWFSLTPGESVIEIYANEVKGLAFLKVEWRSAWV